MKVWYHVIAALVGFAVAALIVYWVFGNASQEGATQEGSAGNLGAAESLCGTVSPAAANSPETRALARDNLPALADAEGPIPSIDPAQKEQVAWFSRVHAASGLCIDEIKLTDTATTINMSTVEGVTEQQASAFAAGALAQAFSQPLHRPRVTLLVTVGEAERRAVVTRRAWDAFQIARQARGLPLTMRSLAQFRQSTSFAPADLRVTGWR